MYNIESGIDFDHLIVPAHYTGNFYFAFEKNLLRNDCLPRTILHKIIKYIYQTPKYIQMYIIKG